MSDGMSAGEWAGAAGGAVSLLTLIGGGLRWLVSWRETRELALDARIDARLTKLEGDAEQFRVNMDRWRVAFKLVADELARIAPHSPKLAQARALLVQAFPTDPFVPPEMGELLDRLP